VTVVAAPVASGLTPSSSTPLYGATFTLTPTYSAGTGSINNGVTCPATGVASSAITANWSGARTYTLTVTNAAGATATTSVTVTPQTVTIAKGSGVTTATPSIGYSFSATVSGAANSNVNWTATGGTFSPTSTASGATTTWTAPATAGTYTVTATSAALGSVSTSWSVTVTSGQPPSLSTNGFGTYLYSYSYACDDSMASGGYAETYQYNLMVKGTWDSCVVTAPGGITFNYGANAGDTNQGASVVVSTWIYGVSAGPCTWTDSGGFSYGAPGDQWTLVATRSGQQATWYFSQ
jgi:hypothetical protein